DCAWRTPSLLTPPNCHSMSNGSRLPPAQASPSRRPEGHACVAITLPSSQLPAVRGVLALAASAGCAQPQSMLAPAGPRATVIAETWWLMFWGSLLIQVLVVGLAVYVLWWRRRRAQARDRLFVLGGGLLLPLVVLSALLLDGFRVGALLSAPAPTRLEIEVVGRQFWWEIRYPGEPPVAVVGLLRIP